MALQKTNRKVAVLDKLLAKDTSPSEWFMFQWLLEALSLAVISNKGLHFVYFEHQRYLGTLIDPTAAAVFLVVACVTIQLIAGISFVRGLYSVLIGAALSNASRLSSMLLLFLAAPLILECVRTTDRCFSTNSLFAEQNNYIKVLHFLSVASIMSSYSVLGTEFLWLNCAALLSSLVLIAIRLKICAFSALYSRLSEVTYVPLLVNAVLNMAIPDNILPNSVAIAVHVGIALLYISIRSIWPRPLQIPQSLGKSNELITTFEAYLYELSRQAVDIGRCRKIVGVVSSFDPSASPQETPKFQTRDKYRLALLNYLEDVYKDSKEPKYLLLLAQGYFYVRKDYVKTLHILKCLEESLHWSSIQVRISMYRLRREVEKEMVFQWNREEGVQKHFRQHHSFLELLDHAKDKCRQWWVNIGDRNTAPSTLRRISKQLVESRALIRPAFEALQYKTRELVNLYVFYLYCVERNTQILDELISQSQFYAGVHLQYRWDHTLYLQLSAESDSFGNIVDVGSNCLLLLGFHRTYLVSEPMSVLIPEFFRADHQQIIQAALDNGFKTYSFSRSVLVQDENRQCHDAKLSLSLWPESSKVSFRGSLQFERGKFRRTIFVLDEGTGKVLSGSQQVKEGCHVSQLAKQPLYSVLGRLQARQPIDFEVDGQVMFEDVRLIRKIKYGERYAMVVKATRISQAHNWNITSTRVRPATSNVLPKDPHTLKGDSAILNFISKKENKLNTEYSQPCLGSRLVSLWAVALVLLCCSSANIVLERNIAESKIVQVKKLGLLSTQQIGLFDLLVWTRQMDFGHHVEVKFSSINYDDFTEFAGKVMEFSQSLATDESIDSTVQEYASGSYFTVQTKIFLRSITSAAELIIRHYHVSSEGMKQMAHQEIDFIIYNWKEASMTAIKQIKDRFYSDFNTQKNISSTMYLALFVFKCVLTVGVSVLLLVYDWMRIRQNASTLDCLLMMTKDDARVALSAISSFDCHLTGLPDRPGYTDRIIESQKDTRRMGYETQSIGSVGGTSSIALSNRTESFSPIETNHRFKITTTNAAATETEGNDHSNRFAGPPRPRPNIPFIILIVLVSALVLTVSTVSWVGTLSKGYQLNDYITNAFSLSQKSTFCHNVVSSFSRLALSFLAFLDPADTTNVFEKTLQQYSTMRAGINYVQLVMMYEEFAEFNDYKDNIDIQAICTYTSCKHYIDAMNVTLDSAINDRVLFMLRAVNSTQTWEEIMLSIDMQYLAELLYLLFQLSRQEMRLFNGDLKTHVEMTSKYQTDLYLVEIGCIVGFLVLLVPFSRILAKSRQEDVELLQLIDSNSFIAGNRPQALTEIQMSDLQTFKK